MVGGNSGSTRSNERHESVTPWRNTTGTPSASPCSTYSIRTPVESDTTFVIASSIPVLRCTPRDLRRQRVTRYSQRMPSRPEQELLTAAGRDVAITNPHKVLFPQTGHTKLDLARYYLAVAAGALRGSGGRPNVLVRHPNGVGGEFFYQDRKSTRLNSSHGYIS